MGALHQRLELIGCGRGAILRCHLAANLRGAGFDRRVRKELAESGRKSDAGHLWPRQRS